MMGFLPLYILRHLFETKNHACDAVHTNKSLWVPSNTFLVLKTVSLALINIMTYWNGLKNKKWQFTNRIEIVVGGPMFNAQHHIGYLNNVFD